ncbi:MAG TPA: cytochrome c biogenesis protein CcdC [Virgibacillus sp.]|nr:cytochrome c biogenesis protein CcdC [Virgibacillus sp.]
MPWVIISTVVAIFMGITMIFIRLKTAEKPSSRKRIILPPLFMSSGALMFLFPVFQVLWLEVFEALGIGILFSIFLIKTSRFEIRDKEIYLIPSKAFIIILFGLLFIRVAFKLMIGSSISPGETSGMFYLLALGMIFSWRLSMLWQYQKLAKQLDEQGQ